MNRDFTRRQFLRLTGLAPFLGLGTACSVSGNIAVSQQTEPGNHIQNPFTPVIASPDRLIRTVAGLRPYRPSGFVVRAERFDHKTVIHNYGHGGAGVTLSWGTASLAVAEAVQTGASHYAVLGCGAVGLATARLLQREGFSVTIYARDLPPETTSNIAGALWFPTSVYEADRVSAQFLDQFTRACRISQRFFQGLVGDHYGVRWLDLYFLQRERVETVFPGGPELYPGRRQHNDPETYFGYPYTQQLYAMMIDPTVYLAALVRDFYMAGGTIVVQTLTELADVLSLPAPVIINCTGLGAASLFKDKGMIPVKGQLGILLPQAGIDYGYVAPEKDNLLYMFPRTNELILGGTSEYGNASLHVDPSQIERILRGHANIAAALV